MRKKVLSFELMIFCFLVIVSSVARGSDVVINEVMPSNHTTAADQNGQYDDWIELYNNSGSSVDLSGYYLSDKKGEYTKWKFPSNTIISGNGYLIVWADKDTLQNGLHANFKLSASGEKVYLVDPNSTVLDHITFGATDSTKELSYSRVPNGTGDFVWQKPTFKINNDIVSSVLEIGYSNFSIYPNPAVSTLQVNSEKSGVKQQLDVFTLSGSKKYSIQFNNSKSIDISSWKNGIYFLSVDGQPVKKVLVNH
jgi:hypothetical protein